MGQYGLAKSLGIDNLSAKNFIDRYFARYPGVAGKTCSAPKNKPPPKATCENPVRQKALLPDINQPENANARAGAEAAPPSMPHARHRVRPHQTRHRIDVRNKLSESAFQTASAANWSCRCMTNWCWKSLKPNWICQEKLPQIMAKVDGGLLDVPLVAEVGVGRSGKRHVD